MNEVTCSVTSAHVEHKKDWKCRWYGLLLHIFSFLLFFLCSNDCTLVFLWHTFSSMLNRHKKKKQLPGSHRSQTVVWNHIHAVSSFSSSAVRLCTVIVPLSLTITEQNRIAFLKIHKLLQTQFLICDTEIIPQSDDYWYSSLENIIPLTWKQLLPFQWVLIIKQV